MSRLQRDVNLKSKKPEKCHKPLDDVKHFRINNNNNVSNLDTNLIICLGLYSVA